jgi:hypothetical protein
MEKCELHTFRLVCGPGTISAQCKTCKLHVAAMFAPGDDLDRVVFVLADQARQQLSPNTGVNTDRARALIEFMLPSAKLEAKETFLPPAEGEPGSWASETRVWLWRWEKSDLIIDECED